MPAEHFEDAWIGRRAARWIDEIPDDYPWHLFVSFVGPHDPFDPPTEYADRYRGAPMPPAIQDEHEGKPAWIKRRNLGATQETVAVCRRQYCAATELIDDAVGVIIEALERRGMRDNTYIVFASDHGEMLGDHGIFTKSVPYEGAIRVPLIVAGPGLPRGRVSDALVELIDLNPTLCEFAGLGPQEHIDARTLGPVLRGDVGEHRQDVLSTLRQFRVLRTAAWKLIENTDDRPELYDMVNDPDELHNVADERPEVLAELRGRLGQRLLERQGEW